ncbi:hypothetical protein ACFYXF_10060 [Streptomyces sp. NPDC002680]|uniref:hypothetical protein n=1 Tax=Streptomyces sp. NPDC002680 TaxID=3364659 RepID=UPI00367FA351
MVRRKRSLSRAAALGTAAAALALLTSCTQSGSTANSSPPNPAQTPSPSAAASAPASAPTDTSAGAPAGTSPGTSAGHTTAGSPPKPDGCRSLLVPPTVKTDVTAAYGKQAQPPLTHIAPVKGTFYYGSCDGTLYAGTRFQLTPGATKAEQVALQDDGAAMKYFTDTPNTGWSYVASDGFPADPQGCAAITQIPASLAALWNDCRSTPGQQ